MPIWLRYSCVLFFLTVLAGQASAQFRPRSEGAGKVRGNLSFFDARTEVDSVLSLRSERSPALATIFSALVPGSGQIYVERYWTLPLIWGFGYWFVRQYIATDRKYAEWRAKYTESVASGLYGPSGDGYAKYVRDFYRDQRDSFAFYFAITYVLNIVDAYVGASLYNFDVSPDLGGTAKVRLTMQIPLH